MKILPALALIIILSALLANWITADIHQEPREKHHTELMKILTDQQKLIKEQSRVIGMQSELIRMLRGNKKDTVPQIRQVRI